MVGKNQIKLITALQQKKFRQEHGLFVAEGAKVISELIDSRFQLEQLYVTEPLFDSIGAHLKTVVHPTDLQKMSALKTANNCLGVFRMADPGPLPHSGLIVALDEVRDPGNLGTIIRLCDWFGVDHLVCSQETADVYNPKVIQATMGSIARIQIHYTDLTSYLINTQLPVYGTFMDGDNLYRETLMDGIVVFGNEANGISTQVEQLVTRRIAIPRFGKLQMTESLNVGTAVAVVLSEFRRGS